MDDHFHGVIFNNFVEDNIMAWGFVAGLFFIIPTISAGEVGFAGRAIGEMN